MPFAVRDGCRLYWKLEGAAERRPVLLLHSIGTDMSLWDRGIPYLLPAFHVLRMDIRGHGASDAPEGDYNMAGLADDARAVMDAAGIESAAVAGVSLGGMIAMELALSAPERVTGLGLICTSAALDPAAWADRVATVRAGGVAAIADLAMSRFLSPNFAHAHPALEQTVRAGLLATPAAGYAGAGAAIRDMDLLARLPALTQPTLIVTGKQDVSTPYVGHGDRIAGAVPGATVAQLDAAHLAPIEAPAELAALLRRFFMSSSGDEQAASEVLFEAGLENRRRVLGDAWVDRALARRTPFNADFQAMITRIAWHEIWGRPGLDDRTRRLLVIAVTVALGRLEEFRLHVRAGLSQGGFTRDELKEVLMQTAIYAGVPASNTAFAEASKVMAELDDPTPLSTS